MWICIAYKYCNIIDEITVFSDHLFFFFCTVYVQEVGRAGRDGHAAEAVLYFNNSDLAEKPIENSMI